MGSKKNAVLLLAAFTLFLPLPAAAGTLAPQIFTAEKIFLVKGEYVTLAEVLKFEDYTPRKVVFFEKDLDEEGRALLSEYERDEILSFDLDNWKEQIAVYGARIEPEREGGEMQFFFPVEKFKEFFGETASLVSKIDGKNFEQVNSASLKGEPGFFYSSKLPGMVKEVSLEIGGLKPVFSTDTLTDFREVGNLEKTLSPVHGIESVRLRSVGDGALLKQIENLRSDTLYKVAIDYLHIVGEDVSLEIWQTNCGEIRNLTEEVYPLEFEEEEEGSCYLAKEEIVTLEKNSEFLNLEKTFRVEYLSTYFFLALVFSSDEKKINEVAIRNISLSGLPVSSPLLVRSLPGKELTPAELSFGRKNPTKYEVVIQGRPAADIFLVFNTNFNPDWYLSAVSRKLHFLKGDPIAEYPDFRVREYAHRHEIFDRFAFGKATALVPEERHLIVNAFANGWLVKKELLNTEESNLLIEFIPQRNFYTGVIISAVVILFTGVGYVFFKKKDR